MITPVPEQLAVHVGVIAAHAGPPKIGRQDPHRVALPPKVLHRRLPGDFVPAEVVRWVHVPEGQDPHRGSTIPSHWPRRLSASLAPVPALTDRLAEHDWYHTIELPAGVVTEGMFDIRPFVPKYGLPTDLSGERILDVGTFDGFWAFEMERRGGEVTALDVDSIQELDWPPRLRPAEDRPRGGSFRLAHELLQSSVRRIGMSVYDATPDALGTFDLVFCGSVLIHLRDPMLALERMAGLCHGRLILAEERSRRLAPFTPVSGAEFTGSSPWSTWWRPTARTWLEMVHCAGFEGVRRHSNFSLRLRGKRKAIPHTVVHARGRAERRPAVGELASAPSPAARQASRNTGSSA